MNKARLKNLSWSLSYKRSEKEELKTVNQNNSNNNVVSDSDSVSDHKNEDNVFDAGINNKVEATPKTTINAKVVHVTKKLQASCNDDANKII